MCDLEKRIKDFVENHGIAKDSLTYRWNGDDEDAVIRRFSDWNTQIKSAVRDNDKDVLTKIIKEIFTWGKVGTDPKAEDFAGRLLNGKLTVFGEQTTPLASWSKVLAAYDPQQYYIYDSRVAVALKMLYWGDERFHWFIPQGRELLSVILNKTQESDTQRESYGRYLRLLNATGNAPHYERQLFMLGDLFEFQCDQLLDCIKVKRDQ